MARLSKVNRIYLLCIIALSVVAFISTIFSEATSWVYWTAGAFVFSLVTCALFEMIRRLIVNIRRVSSADLASRISEIGDRYRLPDGTSMFFIEDREAVSIANSLSKMDNIISLFKDPSIYIYHSLQAKESINWVEFVFWDFLANLKKELNCKIIIALHTGEDFKECNSDLAKISHYKKCYKNYSIVAKKLIGSDIRIMHEEDARIRHPKYYASHFHDVFVSRLLHAARNIENCACDLKGFHRQLSYMESTLPVMLLSRIPKYHNRLFFFDRVDANQPWYTPPLSCVKASNSFYILSAKTLRDKFDNPLRIFKQGDVLNISDAPATIDSKLSTMDADTIRIMCNLLNVNAQLEHSCDNLSKKRLCVFAKDLINHIETNYKF